MKKLTVFCMMAALVAFIAAPAYAEVQNVKVSGDITIRGIHQNQYDLNTSDDNTTVGLAGAGVVGVGDEDVTSFMTTVGLNVDADLTDNVSASIRLVNERDWSTSYENRWRGFAAGANPISTNEVYVDLAYITLKEMLYSPLTVIVGRQDLWYGDGFIVGANMRPKDIMAPEFTDFTSFDAIRAILDYDPWTVDLLYSRIDEGSWANNRNPAIVAGEQVGTLYANNLVGDDDNIELWGVNVGYVFDQYNAEAEAYYFGQTLPNNAIGGRIAGCSSSKDNVAHIIGVRGSFEPVENLDVRAEFAGEFGRVNVGNQAVPVIEDIGAFACDVSGTYTWTDFSWLPTLGLGYVYMGGEPTGRNDDWNGWIDLYRGKEYSAIHEWQGIYYDTDDITDDSGNVGGRQAGTNQHIIIVDGSVQPTDDILLEARFLHFQAVEQYGILNTMSDRSLEIGDELDLRLTYDYTEDVTFGLLSAWFFPGQYFLGAATLMNQPGVPGNEVESNDIASEVVASVSLSF